MFGSATLMLAHPVAPLAWWALNQPAVTETLASAFGVGEEPLGAARRLQTQLVLDCSTDPCVWKTVETTGLPDGWLGLAIAGTVISFLVPVIIWAVVAIMYKSGVTDRRPPLPPAAGNNHAMTNGDHKFGLFGCFEDMNYCLHGWCCENEIIADVFSTVGATSFWCAMMWFCFAWLVYTAIQFAIMYAMVVSDVDPNAARVSTYLTWFVASIPVALLCATWRKVFREKMGDPNWSGKFMTDCLVYWLCLCCASVQDMRQLDTFTGAKVECCCKLVQLHAPGGGLPIGAPVAVGTVVETNKC